MTRVALLAQLAHAFDAEAPAQELAQHLANAAARHRGEREPAEPVPYPTSGGQDPVLYLFEVYAWSLAWLEPQLFVRHLGALLRRSVERWPEAEETSSHRSFDALSWLLGRQSPPSLRSLQQSLLEPLTAPQRAVIAAYFVQTEGMEATREAWGRVAAHDAAGVGGSWFDVFWPLPVVPQREELLDLWLRAFPDASMEGLLPIVSSESVPFYLPFVTPERLHALLPWLASFVLKEPEHEATAGIVQQLFFLLQPFTEPGGGPLLRARLGDLTGEQRLAVAGLVYRLFPHDDLRELWTQAASLRHADWLHRLELPEWEGGYRRSAWLQSARAAAGLAAEDARARADRDFSGVALQIDAAFDGVAAPGPGERTLFEAEEADSYFTIDVAKGRESHRGRWQDLPTSELAEGMAALSFLRTGGLVYYAPAVMVRYLHWSETWSEDSVVDLCLHLFDGIGFLFTPSRDSDDLREFDRERLALFVAPQRAAIHRFMSAIGGTSEAVAAWARVVAHDASGAPGDWFEVYWPARERPDPQHVMAQVREAFPGVEPLSDLDPARRLLWLLPPELFAERLAQEALFALGTEGGSDRSDSIDRLTWGLHPNWGAERHAEDRARLVTLNAAQRRAVSAVCEACVEKSTLREMWRRAVEHEGDDWFDFLKLP